MFSVTTASTFMACGPKVIYENEQPITQPWTYTDQVAFNFEVQDTSIAYDLHLDVEHNENFGYENAYIEVTTIFPNGKKVVSPLSLQLASSEGSWIGNCSGEKCEIDILLATKAFYNQKGKYSIMINQHSRSEKLEGINALKLKINHAE
jgi:gliding motility-associated lipoprotein GldH